MHPPPISDALLNAPRLALSPRQQYDLEMLMVGGFAPLAGFMTEPEYQAVVGRMRLSGGSVFPIPVVLDVPSDYPIACGGELVLSDRYGIPLAVMAVESDYAPDRHAEALAVYGTDDAAHPGVRYLRYETHPRYLGGPVLPVSLPAHHDFAHLRLTPAQLREQFAARGVEKVVAFQTRNPVHRAHFELMKRAGEEHGAHVLLHPAVGPTKDDDIDYRTRVRSYERLWQSRMQGFATLSLLPLAMRMAGPREALWHALIRKNYGATHFIVGRDHAGPGKNAQGVPFYGLFDAERLVAAHADEIGITLVSGGEMVYVEELAGYRLRDVVEPGHSVRSISGTEVRRMLRANEPIPEWFSFPETIEVLREALGTPVRPGAAVFFTGLSGAGKSTLARALADALAARHRRVTLLDGDVVRQNLSKGLGFSREDRDANVERIGFVAAEIARHGGIALCAAIAPYRHSRENARRFVHNAGGVYIEVYVSTPLSVCESRDAKGLYRQAHAGILRNFTGVDDPYEAPESPELRIDTSLADVGESVAAILEKLTAAGVL